jgi:RNase P subunit RPR2
MAYKDAQKRKDFLKKWQKLNPVKMAKYAREFKQKQRLEILILAGGIKCNNCEFSDYRALQIDHIKAMGNKNRLSQSQLKKDIGINPHKYQVLCANCNWIKRYANNETNHKYLKLI